MGSLWLWYSLWYHCLGFNVRVQTNFPEQGHQSVALQRRLGWCRSLPWHCLQFESFEEKEIRKPRALVHRWNTCRFLSTLRFIDIDYSEGFGTLGTNLQASSILPDVLQFHKRQTNQYTSKLRNKNDRIEVFIIKIIKISIEKKNEWKWKNQKNKNKRN